MNLTGMSQLKSCPLPIDFPLVLCHTTSMNNQRNASHHNSQSISLYAIFTTAWAIGMLVWVGPFTNIVTSNQPCDYQDLQCRLDSETESYLNHIAY
jgi:hypothetical protein